MKFTVFTKPYKDEIYALGKRVAALGVDGIELPVRPGYPVTMDNAATELPKAAKTLREESGISIESIAPNFTSDGAELTPRLFEACGKAGVPIIRVCPTPRDGESYPDAEKRWQKLFLGMASALESNNVAIGIQNHSGRNVPVHAFGLRSLLAPLPSKSIGAVWDAAHNALEGEGIGFALDLIYGPHFKMLNLKNGYKKRSDDGKWKTFWCKGDEGLSDWKAVAENLKKRGFNGVVCLTAEYSEPGGPEKHLAADIAYAKRLFLP